MASHHNAYDPRQPSFRRHDHFHNNEPHLKSAGHHGWRHVNVQGNEKSHSSRHPNDERNHLRRPSEDHHHSSHPPPLPPNTNRGLRSVQSASRIRHSWPPQPTVEDEKTSISREAGALMLLKQISRDSTPSRGSIDQEPVLEDVSTDISNDERRFVLLDSENSAPAATGLPTPPTSEDEKTSKVRQRRPSKLNTDLDEVPEMSKRTATPYSFRPARTPKSEQSPNHFLSPEMLNLPGIQSKGTSPNGSVSQPSSPGRDGQRSPSLRKEGDYFTKGRSRDDIAVGGIFNNTKEAALRRDQPTFDRPTAPRTNEGPMSGPRTSAVDFVPQRSHAPPVRKLSSEDRRHTDTSEHLSNASKLRADNERQRSFHTASALNQLNGSAIKMSPSTSRLEANLPIPKPRQTSRNLSSGNISAQVLPSPPHSPRRSFDAKGGVNTTSPTSRNGSLSGSRSSSPLIGTIPDSPRLPKTEVDWNVLMAANAARRQNHPSRLSASMRQDSLPEMARASARHSHTATHQNSLPYPLDDGPPNVWASLEKQPGPTHDTKSSLLAPFENQSKAKSRSVSPTQSNVSYASSSSNPISRPSLSSRHSATDVPRPRSRESSASRPKLGETRHSSYNNFSQVRKDTETLVKKPHPQCTRASAITGKQDWYTIVGAPTLDFCPDCVEGVFERTVFRQYFRRSHPHSPSTPVQCALGGKPWIRLAWLLTLQQRRSDLKLLSDIAEIEQTTDMCPGKREAIRTWYAIQDNEECVVKDFYVCPEDVKKITALLPSAAGFFKRLPNRMSHTEHKCGMRISSACFSMYIDTLIAAHDKATAVGRHTTPDALPFVSLVEAKPPFEECQRDSLLLHSHWHYHPQAPALPVCEQCFAEVVHPAIVCDSPLARRFTRSPQLLPPNNEPFGHSCTLYSPRMRRVFTRAVQDNDLRYLARKARERRDAELRLQERCRRLEILKRHLSVNTPGRSRADDEEEISRLDTEAARIAEEWETVWE